MSQCDRMARQGALCLDNLPDTERAVRLRALVHMNADIFPFGILQNIVFTLNLHQYALHERKRGLWEIGRASTLLAADRLVLGVRRNLCRARFLSGCPFKPPSLLHILTLQALLAVSLFLWILRAQARPASFVRRLIRGRAAAAHCETEHDT